jgi:hypothetical protein
VAVENYSQARRQSYNYLAFLIVRKNRSALILYLSLFLRRKIPRASAMALNMPIVPKEFSGTTNIGSKGVGWGSDGVSVGVSVDVSPVSVDVWLGVSVDVPLGGAVGVSVGVSVDVPLGGAVGVWFVVSGMFSDDEAGSSLVVPEGC